MRSIFIGIILLLLQDVSDGHDPASEQPQANLLPGHAYLAVGNHTTRALEIYDPDATKWPAPNATFKPSTALGFSATGSAIFDGPNDAKIRRSHVWPDKAKTVLAVTDNSFAGLVVWEGKSAKGTKLWERCWASNSPNIHSGELLPDGNIALAATDKDHGSWVRVYNTSTLTDSNYAEYYLRQAHAVLWDPTYKVLWVCGDSALGSKGKGIITALIVGGTRTNPTLTEDLTKRDTTPTHYPHDIAPYYTDADKLLLSDGDGVYVYDKVYRSFTPLPGAANRPNVKGISNQTDNGYFVETKPTINLPSSNWYTDSVNFYDTESGVLIKSIHRDSALFYKAKIISTDYQ